MTRRNFLLGSAAAAGALAGGCRILEGGGAAGTDPNLSVFLADPHAAGKGIKTEWGEQPAEQNAVLAGLVDEILALRPRPARAVVFGDLALWFGWGADYDVLLPILNRLTEAGIDLYVTTGNHDHRAPLFARFPRQREISPVSGRTVSVIDLGHADLLLLDTLDENPDGREGSRNRVGGAMDEAQFAWLKTEAPRRTRPFLCGAHHSPGDLNGRDVRSVLNPVENFVGWIHGHDHRFSETWFAEAWGQKRVRRLAVLPSAGWWGDIGYGLFRTYSDRAVYTPVIRDFYFPQPPKPGDTDRPPEWDVILREHQNLTVTFNYRVT